MHLSVVFLPFISFILTGLFGRFLGHKGSKIVAISALVLTAILSTLVLIEIVVGSAPCYIVAFK